MDIRFRSKMIRRAWRGPSGVAAGLTALWLATMAAPTCADDPTPFAARAGLDLAREAAQAWSPDAALVYLENDEDVDGRGAAPRWSYLFRSDALDQSRVYSVRGGRIQVAGTLEMRFDAPPLAADWIDSDAAREIAERGPGGEFCRKDGGRLATMLLMRGAFQDANPDQTTWTLVYTAPHAASLFVVVDASAGKVRRTWRG